jgi:hypothetical protein
MCVGEGTPYVGEAEVQERPPSPTLPGPSAIITTSVVFPAPSEVVGVVNPGEVQPACADVGIQARDTVELGRPVARLFVYDGSFDPPRLVMGPAPRLDWTLTRVPGSKTVEIAVPFSSCVRRPAISPHVVERPGRAVITVFGEPPDPNPRPCLRSRGIRRLEVRLKRPLAGLKLFDGSSDPPRLRWPLGPSQGTR